MRAAANQDVRLFLLLLFARALSAIRNPPPSSAREREKACQKEKTVAGRVRRATPFTADWGGRSERLVTRFHFGRVFVFSSSKASEMKREPPLFALSSAGVSSHAIIDRSNGEKSEIKSLHHFFWRATSSEIPVFDRADDTPRKVCTVKKQRRRRRKVNKEEMKKTTNVPELLFLLFSMGVSFSCCLQGD